MKVLVLKAPNEIVNDDDSYVNVLQNAGIDAEELEILSFQYVNQIVLKEKVMHPENYGGFVCTSPRGVVAIKQCLEGNELDKRWSALPIYVVGERTSKVLWEKFQLKSIGHESGSAQELAQFISKEHQKGFTKPLLFPSADLKRNSLKDTLHEVGISVDVVTSYKTFPHPHLEDLLRERFCGIQDKPDALVFFSPSGVNAVLTLLLGFGISLGSYKAIAIGPTTEAALKELGQDVFATAASPSPSGLVQAIKVAQDKINKEN